MNKLKKCPFCGSEVEIKKIPLWNGLHGYYDCYEYKIKCDNCGCSLDTPKNDTIYREDEVAKENVIKIWNKRYRRDSRKVGHWVKSDVPDSMLAKCDVCGFDLGASTFKFCPNCGSIMKKLKNKYKEK